MFYFSRWKTAAILAVPLVLCLAAVPNGLSTSVLDILPAWAQRKVTLGYDLKGGSRYLLAVDSDWVHRDMLERLRTEIRKMLREVRIAHAGVVVRDDMIEVHIREGQDVQAALIKLRELSWPLYGIGSATGQTRAGVASGAFAGVQSLTANRTARLPAPEVLISSEDRLIRAKVTDAGLSERIAQARRSTADLIERRLSAMGIQGSIQKEGSDRIMVEMPGVQYEPILAVR